MDKRLIYLLIGCAVGFILGYTVRTLQELKEKVEKVDHHVEDLDRHLFAENHEDRQSDAGFARNDWITNLALFLVVCLVAFSAFKSQTASNAVQSQQDRSDRIVSCNQQYLIKTIAALNARTQFNQDQNAANVDLQKAQAKFLGTILAKPAPTPDTSYSALNKYFAALSTYTSAAAKSNAQIVQNPYPTATEFLDCVNDAKGH